MSHVSARLSWLTCARPAKPTRREPPIDEHRVTNGDDNVSKIVDQLVAAVTLFASGNRLS
jgi:hypothetical protein